MGGGLTYLENLLKELPKVKNPFKIFVLVAEENNLTFLPSGVKLLKIKEQKSLLGKFLFNQFALRKTLKKYKINILFQMANYAMFFCPAKQVILLRQSHYFSRIFLKNIYPLFSFRKKIDLILRRLLIILSVKAADFILAPSQSMADDIKSFISLPDSKIYVNHYGAHLENFSKSINFAKEKNIINILCTSNYGDHKNFETFLRAIEILNRNIDKDFSVFLTIDFNDSLNKYCATLKRDFELFSKPEINRHVELLGRLSYSKAMDLYKTADIFVWPTLTESFGHPLIEAIASGLPTIVSNIPINKEICGTSALYFEPLDSQDLAKKIKLLIKNPDLRKQLAEQSLQRSKVFHWRNHVQRLLKLFEYE